MLELFDGIQGTMGRILIGMGRQEYASYVNLFVYYGAMIPLGSIGCFYFGLGIYWVWTSFTLSAIMVACGYLAGICRTDWEKLVSEVEKRVSNQNE